MTAMPPLAEAIKQAIHFDTLLEQALEEIRKHAGETWTDHGEHDPGITLLQALCYNVSDLAYRHLLPLTDLLTVEGQEILFPGKFGMDWALACNPVTLDDYRRKILDTAFSSNEMVWRDIQLIPLVEGMENSYRYFYNTSNRSYSLYDTEEEHSRPMLLLGNFDAYCAAWSVWIGDGAELLQEVLRVCRNIGDGFQPRGMKFIGYKYPQIDVEVEEDVLDIYPVAIELYRQAIDAFRPRSSWRAYVDTDISTGPWLAHGTPSEMPEAKTLDQFSDVYGTHVIGILSAISGIRNITKLKMDESDIWIYRRSSIENFGLWDGIETLSDQNEYVRFFKRGRRLEVSKDILQARFMAAGGISLKPPIVEVPELFAGKSRAALYFPAVIRLPSCYELQSPKLEQPHLHQHLLLFEQFLANQCNRLAHLHDLLSFSRDESAWEGDSITGDAWPFNNTDPRHEAAQSVHEPYREQLEAINTEQAQDPEKELAIINYLLGYFGAERASRTLIPEGDDAFLKVQRGYLRQIAELGHDRARIQIDQVSAVQRRIAGRLGWAPQLFDDTPNLSNLPFYVVERRALLPVMPVSGYHTLQEPEDLAVVETGNVLSSVQLTIPATGADLTVGMVIDFVSVDGDSELSSVGPLIVREYAGKVATFLAADSQRLVRNAAKLKTDFDAGKLRWRNARTWLQDMEHDVLSLTEVADDTAKLQRTIATTLYPPDLRAGDVITLFVDVLGAKAKQSKGKRAAPAATINEVKGLTVVAVNALEGWLTVAAKQASDWAGFTDLRKCRWYVERDPENLVDQFSFVVSVVLPRGLLENAAVVDKVDTANWIERIVREEMPAHVLPVLHWLNDQYYKDFAVQYGKWQNGGQPLGDVSYRLLELLSVGQLRDGRTGISVRRIASTAERDTALAGAGGWDQDYINEQELFFVPQSTGRSS